MQNTTRICSVFVLAWIVSGCDRASNDSAAFNVENLTQSGHQFEGSWISYDDLCSRQLLPDTDVRALEWRQDQLSANGQTVGDGIEFVDDAGPVDRSSLPADCSVMESVTLQQSIRYETPQGERQAVILRGAPAAPKDYWLLFRSDTDENNQLYQMLDKTWFAEQVTAWDQADG